MAKKHPAGRETRPHIGIYGRCNSGKSTLLNRITGGENALASPHAGTTTDPVRKNYEILDFAPVVFIDTAGLDDTGPLGPERIAKTEVTLWQIDLALVVFTEWSSVEQAFIDRLRTAGVPFILPHNRIEPAASDPADAEEPQSPDDALSFSFIDASDPQIDTLLLMIREKLPARSYTQPSLFEGLASENDVVVLVCPIDSEAPSGRLILPQVQAIRNLLDGHAIAVVVQPEQLPALFGHGFSPRLVVTDSQAFAEVRQAVPESVEITSFSILLARLKGDPETYSNGLSALPDLQDGDRVLILENCHHQVSCEDIRRVKIPRLLEKRTGKKLRFTVVSGLSPLPEDLASFAFAVQCGGCMVTRTQLINRIRAVSRAGVPVTNYGMLLDVLTR